MCVLQPVDSVALAGLRLRHEAGQVAATALWDESAAAGLLLFCLPEAGTRLERQQNPHLAPLIAARMLARARQACLATRLHTDGIGACFLLPQFANAMCLL